MVEKDNTDAPILAMLMAATTVLTVVVILAVIVLFYWKQDQLMAEHEAKSQTVQGRTVLEQQTQDLPIEEGKKAVIESGR